MFKKGSKKSSKKLSGGGYTVSVEESIANRPVITGYEDSNPPALSGGNRDTNKKQNKNRRTQKNRTQKNRTQKNRTQKNRTQKNRTQKNRTQKNRSQKNRTNRSQKNRTQKNRTQQGGNVPASTADLGCRQPTWTENCL